MDEKGPISKAGIQKGDIITKVDGKEIKTMLNLRTAIYNYKIGDSLEISYLRDGLERTARATLSQRS